MKNAALTAPDLAAIAEPPKNCSLCQRLASYRTGNQRAFPDYFNGPAPSFGAGGAGLLIVGLAPGLHGANRTGRPFTGDYAGRLLYQTLVKYGFAQGTYDARADDGLSLGSAMITNAVRCAPPENKPTPAEIKTCRQFLSARIGALSELRAIVALGRIAHDSTLAALRVRAKDAPFAHGAEHTLPGGLFLFDSYHCSRYNTNTGRLTEPMFESVFAAAARRLGAVVS
ncbi:MAG TPA: uracil-DNA glycosylase [Parvularcula sp.]|nr:uracil-DNA glycosylase [Parvularcula sp.]HBS31024.1 uracil-DNA glycosylase [Parvularcula sp.]HBS35477.1 uracil-DNA glycosylase [Parvularcula sp.]